MFRISSKEEFNAYFESHGDLSFTRIEGLKLPSGPLPSLAQATMLDCVLPAGLTMPENLEGALFVGCRMRGLRFRRSNLFNACFIRCDLSESEFEACDLSTTEFNDCLMTATRLIDCDLPDPAIAA